MLEHLLHVLLWWLWVQSINGSKGILSGTVTVVSWDSLVGDVWSWLSKLGSLPEDMDIDTEYNTVIAVIVRLTTVYTDEHQSGKWQQSLKAAAAFQAKFAVDEKKDDSKESNKDKKKKKSKHAWKQKPPKEGSAETKKVDGKTWKWCAKCSRWTLSHSTSEHTGRPSNEESPTPPAETSGSLPAVGYYLL